MHPRWDAILIHLPNEPSLPLLREEIRFAYYPAKGEELTLYRRIEDRTANQRVQISG
jgi:hypothetical protein